MIALLIAGCYFLIAAILFLMCFDPATEVSYEQVLNDFIACIAWPVTLMALFITRK